MSSDIEFVLESTVRGFHVHRADYLRAVWTSYRTETVRGAPRTVAEVTELVRQAVEPRLTIESFPSRPPAPQRRRRSRYKSRLDLRAHIYVRIRTLPNNS